MKSWMAVVACLLLAACVLHYNHTQYLLQRGCMERAGNWETLLDGGELGCRMKAMGK